MEPIHRPYLQRAGPVAHLLIHCVVTLLIVGAVIGAHHALGPTYQDSVKQLVCNAISDYQVRLNESGDRLELRLDGSLLADRPADDPGPLGLGRYPTMRGVLNDVTSEIDQWSHLAREQIGAAVVVAKPFEGGYEYPCSAFQSSLVLERLRVEGAGVVSEFERIRRTPKLTDVAELQRILTVAPVHGLATSTVDSKDRRAAAVVAEAGRRIPPMFDRVVLSTEVDASLRRSIREWCQALYPAIAPSLRARTLSKEGTCAAPAVTGADDVGVESRIRSFNQNLHDDLKSTVDGELSSCFWLFGCWRWWEIACWTMFGVMVHALYDFGLKVISFKKCVFEPRETVRVFSRLIYAPLVAIVFFWLATTTSLINAPSFLAEHTFGVLVLAFVVGMYPTTIYRLFRTTLDRLLQGGLVAPTDQPTVPEQVRVAGSLAVRPDFEAVKRRIVESYVAPLRTGGGNS